jgi:hypothetical protein
MLIISTVFTVNRKLTLPIYKEEPTGDYEECRFWDVAMCTSGLNSCLGGTSVNTRSTRRHIPEDGILYSHRRENLKSYNKYLF